MKNSGEYDLQTVSVLAHDRDNRKLLYVIVFAMIALITDVSFSQVSDLIVPQSVSVGNHIV